MKEGKKAKALLLWYQASVLISSAWYLKVHNPILNSTLSSFASICSSNPECNFVNFIKNWSSQQKGMMAATDFHLQTSLLNSKATC